jgi:hypothetical protein
MALRKVIILILLLILICPAFAKSEEHKVESEYNINENVIEKRLNFPKNYKGDSLSILINKFKLIDNASKDEFTKSSKGEEDALKLSTRFYRFVISPELNNCGHYEFGGIPSIKFDADNEILNINLCVDRQEFGYTLYKSWSDYHTTIEVSENKQRTRSIGQNSYGASAQITTTHVKEQGLALANIEGGQSIFALSIPLKAKNAKVIKKDLAFYIDIMLISSTSDNYVMERISGVDATIDAPTAIYISAQYLNANIVEAGVFKKSNGEVLGRKIFESL